MESINTNAARILLVMSLVAVGGCSGWTTKPSSLSSEKARAYDSNKELSNIVSQLQLAKPAVSGPVNRGEAFPAVTVYGLWWPRESISAVCLRWVSMANYMSHL